MTTDIEAELLQILARHRALSTKTAISVPDVFASLQCNPMQKLAALYSLFDKGRIDYSEGAIFMSSEF